MDEEKIKLKISVRNLVEFILRSGDLDNRKKGKAEAEAMQAGSRMHRKLQRQMGSLYRPEVSLKTEVPLKSAICVVEGRADGIFEEDNLIWVDEIKGIYRDLDQVQEPVEVHLAQAKCYAFIYAMQNQLDQIGVRITYCNLDTEVIKYFREIHTTEELGQWFLQLMKEYEKWAEFQMEWKMICRESIQSLEFPFVYREGQKELAAGVYRTISRKKRLFIQAPTGVGKTISTVFPAVKAMGEGLGEKLFYLTAKTITRTVAEDTLGILREQGLRLKSVTLTAKEKLCICEEVDCNPDACPYAKGHFDRVNDAVYELLLNGPDDLNREVLLEQAAKYQVCPFELSLDVSNWTDAVICDYNYVFDPNVRLKRFFAEGVKGEYLFLIDEAHNLVERGREMFSASLYKEDFLELKRKIKGRSKKLERTIEKCNKYLLELKRECVSYTLHEDVGAFVLMLLTLMGELEKIQEEGIEAELQKDLQEFYFKIRDFLNTYDRLNENYVIYSELEEDSRFKLKLYCIETAANLRECLDKGNSAIFFSATMLPISYYKHLLGEEDDYAVYAKTTFSQEQRLLLIGQDVTSRYTRRTKSEYERMAAYLASMARARKGNYLFFFPSYKMMLEVYTVFQEQYLKDDCECLLQTPSMNEEKRDDFLRHFAEEQERTLVGFCVLGGVFSEGIDLKREALIGTVIVGTGLPLVCNEREILKNYYEKQRLDGFSYAYIYPGMNKVLQAAGRLIRTREDRGVILLLDERFLNNTYRKLFPLEWEDYQVCRLSQVEEIIKDFWEKDNKTVNSETF